MHIRNRVHTWLAILLLAIALYCILPIAAARRPASSRIPRPQLRHGVRTPVPIRLSSGQHEREKPSAVSQTIMASCVTGEDNGDECAFQCFTNINTERRMHMGITLDCTPTSERINTLKLAWNLPSQSEQFRHELQIRPTNNCTKARTITVLQPSHTLESLEPKCTYSILVRSFVIPSNILLSDALEPQRGDLLAFYFNTQFSDWTNAKYWGTNTSVCTWFGITCHGALPGFNSSGIIPPTAIAMIDLPANNIITNMIPSPFLPNCIWLKRLNLKLNFMDVTFPVMDYLVATQTLEALDLSGNPQLSGPVGEWVFNLTSNLRNVSFANTQLLMEARKFQSLAASLRYLDLQFTYVIGTITDFAPLTNLVSLNLASSGLSTSPVIGFVGFTELENLNLDMVPVSGTWPDLSHSTKLRFLDLSFTKMTGPMSPLPPLLATFNCISCSITQSIQAIYDTLTLAELRLGYAQNLLRITVPDLVMNLPQLSVLSLDGIRVSGDASLFNIMANLTQLSLEACQMDEQQVPDFKLPLLEILTLSSNNFIGTIPPLAGCPRLNALELRNNPLNGAFPTLAYWCTIEWLDLGETEHYGALPSFNHVCGEVRYMEKLLLDNCYFTGRIDDTFLDVTLIELNYGNNFLLGSIPTFQGPSQGAIQKIFLSDNDLTGEIPMRAFSMAQLKILDLNRNFLEGDLDFSLANVPALDELRVSENLLSGVVAFASSTTLLHFDCSQNIFNRDITHFEQRKALYRLRRPHARDIVDGLEWRPSSSLSDTSPTTLDFLMTDALATLMIFDGSHNNWIRFLPENLPPDLQSFTCSDCGLEIDGLPPSWARNIALENIVVSRNNISNLLEFVPPNLIALDCSFSSMTGGDFFTDLLTIAEEQQLHLQYLDVSYSTLASTIPSALFSTSHSYNWLLGLRELDLSNCGLVGALPEISIGFTTLTRLDLSGNPNLEGMIPDSFMNFYGLRELRLDGNLGLVNASGGLPSFILPAEDGSSTTNATGGYSCPNLRMVTKSYFATQATTVTIDPSYHGYNLCQCLEGFFGTNAICSPCGEACTCQGSILSDCWPVAAHHHSSENTSSNTLEHYTFLPCPLSMTGASLCNPQGLPYNFSSPPDDTGSGSTVLTPSSPTSTTRSSSTLPPREQALKARRQGHSLSPSFADPASNTTTASSGPSWCWTGHEGRLCGKCQPGWFASGRSCNACLSRGLHVLILLTCGILFLALLVFLFLKTPTPTKVFGGLGISNQINQRAKEQAAAGAGAGAPDVQSPLSPSAADVEMDVDRPIDGNVAKQLNQVPNVEEAIGILASKEPNYWKLLLFHLQQLGVILYTQTSLPTGMITFLSVSNTASSFSFSSLIAVECVHRWDIADQIWASFVVPGGILAVVGALFIFQKWRVRRGADVEADGADVSEDVDPSLYGSNSRETRGMRLSHRIWRIFGISWSLLFIVAFPCAALALSALGCTDVREGFDHTYLNQLPWVSCNSDFYKKHVLPPAILSAILWLFVFPVFSTLLYFRLRRALFMGESNVWSVLGQLVSPYKIRFWFWEQVILFRRLALVACVALVPGYSLYLPLLLFSLIQVSALLQHVFKPYASEWSHRAELASLYILQLNYFTALVLHKSAQRGSDYSEDEVQSSIWTSVLFLVNVVFVILLLCAISFSFRRTLSRLSRTVKRCFRRLQQPRRIVRQPKTPTNGSQSLDASLVGPSGSGFLDESAIAYQPHQPAAMFYVDANRQLRYVGPTPKQRSRANSTGYNDSSSSDQLARSKSFTVGAGASNYTPASFGSRHALLTQPRRPPSPRGARVDSISDFDTDSHSSHEKLRMSIIKDYGSNREAPSSPVPQSMPNTRSSIHQRSSADALAQPLLVDSDDAHWTKHAESKDERE